MIQVGFKKNHSTKLLEINYPRKRLEVGKQIRTLAFFQLRIVKADLHTNKKKENVIRVKCIEFIIIGKTLKLLSDDLVYTLALIKAVQS